MMVLRMFLPKQPLKGVYIGQRKDISIQPIYAFEHIQQPSAGMDVLHHQSIASVYLLDNFRAFFDFPARNDINPPLLRDLVNPNVASDPPGTAGRICQRLSFFNNTRNKKMFGNEQKVCNAKLFPRVTHKKEVRVFMTGDAFYHRVVSTIHDLMPQCTVLAL